MYSFEVLLKWCLGINEYDIFSKDQNDYIIVQENRKVVIKNHFFKQENISKSYTKRNLPKVIGGDGIQSLYGEPQIKVEDTTLYMESDIVASTFFLTSHWEQLVVEERDKHGRFSSEDSLLVKSDILGKPLVNQYANFLLKWMNEIGINVSKKSWYKPTMTHDIDRLYKWRNPRSLLGAIKKNLPNINEAFRQGQNYFRTLNNRQNDAFYNYEYLIKEAKKYNINSCFFIMSGKSNPIYDENEYIIENERKFLKRLNEEEVEIGIHFSYDSYKDINILKYEKERLERTVKKNIELCRQHYLRYEISSTWHKYERLGLQKDSTLQFSEGLGFFSGISTCFPLFSLKERRKTKIIEVPLLIMKKQDQEISDATFLNKTEDILIETRKYNSNFMVLFHNSDVDTNVGKKLYSNVLEKVSKEN